MTEVDALVTLREAAEMLGISARRARHLCEAGLLPEAGRASRAILVHRSDVERLAREGWPGRRGNQPPG